jgi:hypothetical protein
LITRDELILAVWGDAPPRAVDSALGALLSKLRRTLAPVILEGHRVALPADGWVDLDAARASIHRAESALTRDDHPTAWAAAQTTLFAARRGFLPGEDPPRRSGRRAVHRESQSPCRAIGEHVTTDVESIDGSPRPPLFIITASSGPHRSRCIAGRH